MLRHIGWVAYTPGPEDSVFAVLQCTYAFKVPTLKAKKETDSKGGSNLPKLSAVLAEVLHGRRAVDLHRAGSEAFFAGQRIMVRFRLVGRICYLALDPDILMLTIFLSLYCDRPNLSV